jgi:hypothetical protein
MRSPAADLIVLDTLGKLYMATGSAATSTAAACLPLR